MIHIFFFVYTVKQKYLDNRKLFKWPANIFTSHCDTWVSFKIKTSVNTLNEVGAVQPFRRTRPRLKFTLSVSHGGGVWLLSLCNDVYISFWEQGPPASVPVHGKHSFVLRGGVVLSARSSVPANPAKKKNATRPCVFFFCIYRAPNIYEKHRQTKH